MFEPLFPANPQQPESHPTITIDLVVDRGITKDVLHGILHSIFFHRLFGMVKPQTFEVLDVTMPGVSDPEIQQVISEKVDAFWRALEGGTEKRGQIVVIFLEKKEQQKRSWIPLAFLQDTPEIPWEQWIINAELRQPKNDADRQIFTSTLSSTLTKSLHTILTHTTSERGRSSVPLITEAGGVSPFPYKVAVKFNGVVVG